MFSLTEREPGLRSNVCGLARTYGVRLARLLSTTAAVERFWLHGRTVTVTRSVSLVVFLTVNVPTEPRLAVASTVAGRDRDAALLGSLGTRRRVVRLSDHTAGRGPHDGKAESAGDKPTRSALHFRYLLGFLFQVFGRRRYGVSVESVTSTSLR